VNGPHGWPPLRRRPQRLGKHRALLTIPESDMPPVSPAASLPQHDYRTTAELQQAALKPAFDPPAEPDKIVECGFCHVSGLSSLIPEKAGLRRCTDIDGCVQRSLQQGRPPPLLSSAELLGAIPAEELAPLPAAQEVALENFQAAHDEQDAAEAGEDLSEDGEASEAADPAPVAAEDATPDEGDAE
jgi:hypothetical protein